MRNIFVVNIIVVIDGVRNKPGDIHEDTFWHNCYKL
jgi:hypothetical protein